MQLGSIIVVARGVGSKADAEEGSGGDKPGNGSSGREKKTASGGKDAKGHDQAAYKFFEWNPQTVDKNDRVHSLGSL